MTGIFSKLPSGLRTTGASLQIEARLNIFRVVCLLGAITVLVLGAVYQWAVPAAVDPLWGRVAIAVPFLSLYGASFWSAWVRRYFAALLQGLFYVVLLWFVVLTAVNGLSVDYVVGLLFTLAALSLGMTLVLDRLAPLVVFAVAGTAVTGPLFLLGPNTPVSVAVFATCFLGLATLACYQLALALQVRRSLAEKEERHRAVLSQTSEGIFLIDARSLAFLETNDAYRQLVGYTEKELRAHTLRDVEPEDVVEDGLLAHLAEVRGRMHFTGDTRHRRQDGTFAEVELSADLIHYGGQKVISAVVRDVAARREAERTLRRSKRQLEQTLRAKTSLFDTMSHELRTPLSSIIGYAEVIAEEADTPQHREFARTVSQSGARLNDVLETILELARLEGGEVLLSPELIDLRAVAKGALDKVRPVAERKGLDLRLTADPEDGPFTVRTDRHAAQQALRPLVENAVKFTDDGRVVVTIETDDEVIRVYVSDTGPGLREDRRDRLFEAFTQGSSGLARIHEGIGAGLALAQRHARLLNGSLNVEETGPDGTTFCLCLPTHPPVPEAPRTGRNGRNGRSSQPTSARERNSAAPAYREQYSEERDTLRP